MNTEKLILYSLTLFVDAVLLNEILYFSLSMTIIDLIFCVLCLLSHFVFYYALYNNLSDLLGILHILMGGFIVSSLFLKNILIVCLCIFLLFIVQSLWIIYDRCIINDFDDYFINGYSKIIRFCTIIFTIILSIRLGILL